MRIVLDLAEGNIAEALFCLDDLDICPCNKCEVYFGLDDLAVPKGEEGQAEEGFMCRPCLEASGKEEFYIT